MLVPAQVIQRKRDGVELGEEEIRQFIVGFTRGEIPDYQMAALAMAICFQGMTDAETLALTRAMVESGDVLRWPSDSIYVDKHSSGGIGDKVSLILAPLVACCGLKVPMLSGRGLGPTGGTLDKLESIPGFRTDLSVPELQRVTETVGCVITGTTPEIAPADRKLYALRDVTATVSCLPLIVASIMSKKLAANITGLVLDVKWGSGAFMRTRQKAAALARALVAVGKRYGKRVVALQTDMNQPLGSTIGNALEVRECLDMLAGQPGAPDLRALTLALGAEMLLLAEVVKDVAAARQMLENKLACGAAMAKFGEMVAAQGGTMPAKLPTSRYQRAIQAPRSGVIQAIAGDELGYAVIALGGGRQRAGEQIDRAVGFEQPRRIGTEVVAGEPLLIMHYNDETRAAAAETRVRAAYRIGQEPATPPALVTDRFE